MPPPTKPPRTQPNPLGPPGFSPLLFEGFTGLETSASRPGLKDDQCYIMDGWFPFGPNNLRTMWGIGTAIFTPSSNASVVFFDFANFGATPVMIAPRLVRAGAGVEGRCVDRGACPAALFWRH